MPLYYECHYCDYRETSDNDEDRFCHTCDTQICTDCGIYDDEQDTWYCESCNEDRHEEQGNLLDLLGNPNDPIDPIDDPWDDPGIK